MTHDPLCPYSPAKWYGWMYVDKEIPCQCHFIAKIRNDQNSKHINPNCMWGEAECIPDCPSCRRFDELYLERSVGYWEGYNNALNSNKECSHQNAPDIWKNEIPYCRKCGKNMSAQYEMGD